VHLLLLALELEEIEQVTARQETFFAEQREHLLADEQRPETRLALVELRALAQVLEERVVAEGLEERAVERARARHLVRPPPPGLELEEQAEDVLQERVEVRDEPAARVDDGRQRRRVGDERGEGAPVVGVALDPAVLARRDEHRPRRGGLRAATGGHQSRPSISCWICRISCLSASARSTGRPPSGSAEAG